MAFWRRAQRRPKRVRFDYSSLPTPPIATGDDARDEGVMLAEYAARMRMKNRILIEAISDGVDYDEDALSEEARGILSELAAEMTDAAGRVQTVIPDAAGTGGRALDMHDYRSADVDNLELRSDTYRAVAQELERRRDDAGYLLGLVRQARDDAWAEVGGVIEDRLDTQRVPSAVDDGYRRGREARLRLFKNVDLARLQLDKLEY